MKATAHWLELKGHTEKKPSTLFDEVFSDQVFATGKIEDGRVLRAFFARTGQPLFQDWLVALVRGLVMPPAGRPADEAGPGHPVPPAHARLGPRRDGDRRIRRRARRRRSRARSASTRKGAE